jgi:hypothetical protein
VYSLLGKLARENNGTETSSSGALSDYLGEEPILWWNEKRLRKAFDQSSPAQQAILKGMASGNGKKWVTVSEVVKQMGDKADWNTMAGALGAFGRRCKSRYKAKTRPFTIRYNHDLGQKEYLMPASVAQAINSF